MAEEGDPPGSWLPFLAGLAVGTAGTALAYSLSSRPSRFDPRLLTGLRGLGDVAPAVLVPGILGSQLLRPDGTLVWLNMRNALGAYDLSLPYRLPLAESRDDLVPGGLLGVDTALPRIFGFTEYADAVDLLDEAGFRRDAGGGPSYHVFTYDWRRDLVESARRLHEALEALAEARGDPDARFNVIGHSMGGLIARYYLRFGAAEAGEDAPVTWAGARRIRNLVLVATPSGGSLPALDALLNGSRVGFSSATLAAPVIGRFPSLYHLLPPAGTQTLLNEQAEPIPADLHDPATWKKFAWPPFGESRRATDEGDPEPHRAFVSAVLSRTGAFHRALARPAATPCPSRVVLLGGDTLPTLARAIVPSRPGAPVRFEPWTKAEAEAMIEAGDARVTRASLLASHLTPGETHEAACGIPEVSQAFLGAAEHHGIYGEPTFQSLLLKILLRPATRD